MYLFDTDTLSNIVRKKPCKVLLKKLQQIPKELQYTSSINIGEIYYGANKSDRKEKIIKAFEENVFPNIKVLAFDENSGKLFGQLKADLEREGIGCSESDLRIATIALQHELILVSGNIRHFRNIPGLNTENWIEF
jgi:predicted nucleic acid-binding protein